MKLCRIGNVGEEKPAIIDEENNFRDLYIGIGSNVGKPIENVNNALVHLSKLDIFDSMKISSMLMRSFSDILQDTIRESVGVLVSSTDLPSLPPIEDFGVIILRECWRCMADNTYHCIDHFP